MGKKLMSRLRDYREKKGMTQEEIAKMIGVSRQTVVAIERGNYVPSVALAMDISKLFHQQVEELFYWA